MLRATRRWFWLFCTLAVASCLLQATRLTPPAAPGPWVGWGHEGAAGQEEAPLLAVREGLWWGLQDRARQRVPGGCGGCRGRSPRGELQPALLPAPPQGMDFRGPGWDLRTRSGLSRPRRWVCAVAQPWQQHHGLHNAQGLGRAVPAPWGTSSRQGWHNPAGHIVLHISITDVGQTLGGIPCTVPHQWQGSGCPLGSAHMSFPPWAPRDAQPPIGMPQGVRTHPCVTGDVGTLSDSTGHQQGLAAAEGGAVPGPIPRPQACVPSRGAIRVPWTGGDRRGRVLSLRLGSGAAPFPGQG